MASRASCFALLKPTKGIVLGSHSSGKFICGKELTKFFQTPDGDVLFFMGGGVERHGYGKV